MSCLVLTGIAAAAGDPVTVMMASQQCKQAEESKKSEEENKDAQEKVAEGESEKGVPTAKASRKNPPDEKILSRLGNYSPRETPSSLPDPKVEPVQVPALKEKAEVAEAEPVQTELESPVSETFLPEGVERSLLGYDETGVSGSIPAPERPLPPGTTVVTESPRGAGGGDASLREKIGSAQLEKVEKRLLADNGTSQAVPVAGGNGDAVAPVPAPTPERDSVDSILLALKGGSTAPAVKAPSDVLALPPKNAPDDVEFTIFHYANYRYQKLQLIGVLQKGRTPVELPTTSIAEHRQQFE